MLLNQSGIHLKKNHKQFMFFSMKHNKSYMLAVPLIRKEENTSIFTKKDARHADTTFHTVASNLTYLEARGLEKQLFVENYSSILRNKIAGISLRNPNYMDYMRAATEINIDRYENWWYIFTGR